MFLFSGQRCAHHKSLCAAKIEKLCMYVSCDSPEVKELCPEQCNGKDYFLDLNF